MGKRAAGPFHRVEVSQVINVTTACNQRCLFCSRGKDMYPYTPEHIKKAVRLFKDTVCFEGGEPTIFPDILKWIRYARKEGVRDIILVTNGYSLEDPAEARKYLDAGITLFNVNLPAHETDLYDALTQTRCNFPKRVEAVRTLIRVAGGHRVRVTLVATSLIMPNLPDYARFIIREFPELRYLEINFPKKLGKCITRTWLIPALSNSRKPLQSALKIMKAEGIQVITDGFPLCVMKGFEHCAIDTQVLYYEEHHHCFLGEKTHCPPCAGCSLKSLCMGPRKDYVSQRGWGELSPSRLKPAAVTARIEKKQELIQTRPTEEREGSPSRPRKARKTVTTQVLNLYPQGRDLLPPKLPLL